MIPKQIHYCWFGRNPLPDLAIKCIDSWKKYIPDYEIIQWNEDNYDIHKNTYISQAYSAKKYAFVSDYARFDILYNYGGLYFDVDVEIIKNMTEMISKGSFMALESIGMINSGLGLSGAKGNSIYKEVIDSYINDNFIKLDGTYNLRTIVERVSDIFHKHGFKDVNEIQTVSDITIYPVEYFCPKDYKTGKLTITDNTHSIHHYDGSWTSEAQRKYDKTRQINCKFFGKHLGSLISIPSFLIWQIKDYGIKKVFFKLMGKLNG